MTPEFKRALAKTAHVEGGFVNHPNDRGGPTKYGVTLTTLSGWMGRPATIDDIRDLKHETAEQLYFDLFWNDRHLPCQRIAEWWEPLGWEMFDSGVLHRQDRAARFLQQALNLLNYNGKLFPDLEVDGWAGETTLAAMRKMADRPRGREILFRAVNIEQAVLMRELALVRSKQEDFYGGWILKRVQMEADQ